MFFPGEGEEPKTSKGEFQGSLCLWEPERQNKKEALHWFFCVEAYKSILATAVLRSEVYTLEKLYVI